MDDQKQQLLDKLQSAANILVTVSNNPSVDQLAACIALTLALNKLDKHATAVFSGKVPETIEFLKPEETLEKNTDSLRDFIIALDKSKADKLRYKVEDKVVKIFITPYRTSISEEDLNFSQGDFNVDVVVALGVKVQQDLDQAITAHGRILHDATVVSVSNSNDGELGSINWRDPKASSLSELSANLIKQLDKKLLDGQIATALLTGIVAATDRFRNENTSAQTMSVSADLMAAGANQQLVTSELEHAVSLRAGPRTGNSSSATDDDQAKKDAAGTLEINHNDNQQPPPAPAPEPVFDAGRYSPPEPPQLPPPVAELPEIHEVRSHPDEGKEPEPYDQNSQEDHNVMTEPPMFGSALTAADKHDDEAPFEASPDLESAGKQPKLLSHDGRADANQQSDQPPTTQTPPNDASQPSQAPPELDGTLDVSPPHNDTPLPMPPEPSPPSAAMPPQQSENPPPPPPTPEPAAEPTPPPVPPAEPEEPVDNSSGDAVADVEAARSEVMRALSEQPEEALPPIAALNAQPLGDNLHPEPPMPPGQMPTPGLAAPMPPGPSASPPPGPPSSSPADQPLDMPLPPSGSISTPPPQSSPPTNSPVTTPNAPPPVPPPMTPPAWNGSQH